MRHVTKLYRVFLVVLLMAVALVQPRLASADSNLGGQLVSAKAARTVAQMAPDAPNAVYVLTNQITGNGVAVFSRDADGALSEPEIVPTGGQGISTGLGSQGAIILSEDGQWLFAVNAGSDEISVFAVRAEGLELTDKVASGGVRPTSIANHEDLVYVLNAGSTGNITGFRLGEDGQLTPMEGSTRHLSNLGLGDSPAPAQISFDPKGEVLVVTERMSNMISTYQVGEDGMAYGPIVQPSVGMTPFGFAFTQRGTLVVSEAFGGDENASAVSSYMVAGQDFSAVSESALTEQTAACWVAVTKNGRYAYVANAGSSSVSSYRIAQNGALTLIDSQAGMTGEDTAPVDLAISHDSHYLYVLSARSQNVIAYAVQSDGSLMPLGDFGGLPTGTAGIAVY
jgi:6-phosphogluconolactonase (cycloisomerase 2 family)